ncbi:MAG: precorrin-2 C(20)-methyltransferase [Proteobacteria bacterium]|nr:precorrin-2 C(20)-methyltransferase [Pseudomonadota bacterium]
MNMDHKGQHKNAEDRGGGTLYGLGIGPGDPELITLKALKIIQSVAVIAYPAPEKGDSLARSIAAAHFPGGQTEICIRTPMTPGNFPADDVYDRYATEISGHLTAGRDVAVLCEGDPFLYGSFMYIFARLSRDHPTKVVPGVSSLGACAAASGRPLVSRNQTLSILPAPMEEQELERRLLEADAAAIMKVGRHMAKVKRVLTKLGLDKDACYVERASMAEEKVCALQDMDEDAAPYFSMVLVRRDERPEP